MSTGPSGPAGLAGPSGLVIRPANAADVPVIAALEAECLGADAWSEQLIAEGVAGGLPTVRHLVAEQDAAVVGYATGSFVAEVAELQRIAVAPAYRRRSVATALLDAVLDVARQEGASSVLLEVREDNEGARTFYATRGFRELDRRPRYYRDGADALVLQRDLPDPDGSSPAEAAQ